MERYSSFYVGTYTIPILFGTGEVLEGKGEGIYLLNLDREKGKAESCLLMAKAENPSYLCLNKAGNRLYAVNERKTYGGRPTGTVTSFSVDQKGGGLTEQNHEITGGQDPCHLALSADESILVVTNFMTGSVCAYDVGKEGLIGQTGFFQHQGSGPDPIRQKGPHAHSCIFIEHTPYFIIPDLGMDCLMVYRIEKGTVTAVPEMTYRCKPGSGPRYGEYLAEKKILYIINELDSSISALKWDQGKRKWTHLQTISTIQSPVVNICADLHLSPNGRFLYASNRGADSLVVYEIHGESGELCWIQEIPSGGRTPRNFTIDREGEFLLAANQDSGQVAVFRIHKETGRLEKTDVIGIPTPVCVCQRT